MGDPSQGSTSTGNGGGGGRRRRREIETLSVEIGKYPRDLFHSFLSTDPIKAQNRLNRSASEEQEDGGIELNLGLSLGGRFGVDKSNGGLIRASSLAGTMPTFREVQESEALARTASLPVETEEEWRRRKEMQTLRRMQAKRRRSEKQRSIKENNCDGAGEGRERQQLGVPGKLNPNPGPVLAGQWGGSSRQGSGGFEAAGVKGKGGFFGSLQGLLGQQVQQQQQQLQGCSQGSGESYGGGSSGVSELESKAHQGSGSCGEARSPASTHSTQERGSQEPSPVGSSSSSKYAEGSTSKHPETSDHKKKEAAATGGIEDMPCVFTIGDGPNGRKVEGILYKYGKGGEVRIMCVCHGSFFSPAEFVKHAGGCDVEHPLRHIVVNPSPTAF